MKLLSLLQRRQADRVPLLPSTDSGGSGRGRRHTPKRSRAQAQEERLERLLTPGEREIVEQHRL